jgi:F0F1-type ATP synthase membrane subunit b/b'
MCDFISYIEKGPKVLFLTNHLIYHTEKGTLLQKQASEDDLNGHGAIRFYFGLDSSEGKERECTDFSDSKNFPAAIVKAVKNGEMRGLTSNPPEGMLTPKARVEYDKVVDSARAEYDKVVDPARAEYDKVVDPASAEYDKVVDHARVEYDKVVDPARAEYNKVVYHARVEYNKVVDHARAEYNKVVDHARVEYNKVVYHARVEYNKVVDQTFWDLFADNRNRTHTWRD